MLSGERNYYRQRIDQESAAAERALSPQARLAHRELADRYSSRLELLESISSGTPYPATARSTETRFLGAVDPAASGIMLTRA